jgi:hypothetical protein
MIFMRILFVNSIQMFGGGEVWMLRTLSALQNRGHEVSLLCRPSTQLEREARAAGISVLTLKMRGDLDPVVIWKTARILRRNKIQIVLTNWTRNCVSRFSPPFLRPVVRSYRAVVSIIRLKIVSNIDSAMAIWLMR